MKTSRQTQAKHKRQVNNAKEVRPVVFILLENWPCILLIHTLFRRQQPVSNSRKTTAGQQLHEATHLKQVLVVRLA
jgi:hypothetical protein